MSNTIHRYRENRHYKALKRLLHEYPEHFVDDLYLVSKSDIEKQDALSDIIERNDGAIIASRAMKLALADA